MPLRVVPSPTGLPSKRGPGRVLGGQGDLAHESSLDSSPAFLRGSRLPVAPALALSV